MAVFPSPSPGCQDIKREVANSVGSHEQQGKEGILVAKTVQALIIAHHPETVLTQACSSTVEQLAEYLKSVGY
jgi:hypothetical protein